MNANLFFFFYISGFPFATGLRTGGYPVIPNQFG